MSAGIFSRRLLVTGTAAAAIPLVGLDTVSAQPISPVRPDDGFMFWQQDERFESGWRSVFANAWLDATARNGRCTVTLEFTPSGEEMYALMYETMPSEVASHVDVVFIVDGLVPLGPETVFAPGGGDHVRFAGAEVSHKGSRTRFTIRCFNIESRWTAGVPILVTGALSGYGRPNGEDIPAVTVQLLPCAYQMSYEDPGDAAYERTTDDVTKYYRRWKVGESPVTLFNSSGQRKFEFRF